MNIKIAGEWSGVKSLAEWQVEGSHMGYGHNHSKDKTPLRKNPCPCDKNGQPPHIYIFFFTPNDGMINYVNKMNSSDAILVLYQVSTITIDT